MSKTYKWVTCATIFTILQSIYLAYTAQPLIAVCSLMFSIPAVWAWAGFTYLEFRD